MTFDDVVAFFGGVSKAKKALGLKSRQTLYNWREDGVPDGEQCRIQIITGGQLTADENAIARRKAKQQALPLGTGGK
jgi:hypothetical protein